jgi:hypothetical protein
MPNLTQSVRHKLLNTFFSRHSIWFLCIFICLLLTSFHIGYEPRYIYYFIPQTLLNSVWIISSALSLLGLYDVLQNKHSILKNYPIMGHFRFLFEEFRPEIRQYFIEADQDALPFSRMQRSLVYQRAKNENADKPFGSIIDVYQDNYRFITHSLTPCKPANPESFRISIGGPQCTQPYSASILNISAMSFGSLSANAIRALNKGAKMGNFYHDTGEGSISPYHLENGGDIVWFLVVYACSVHQDLSFYFYLFSREKQNQLQFFCIEQGFSFLPLLFRRQFSHQILLLQKETLFYSLLCS